MLAVLVGVWRYLVVVVICIFLIANDGEQLSRACLPFVSALRCRFQSLAYFQTGLLVLLLLNFENSVYILYRTSHLSGMQFASIFSQFL